jgi:gamma-glutamyltranspeptidase/glutathione hydrolase
MRKRYLLIIPFIVCYIGCSENANNRRSETLEGRGIIANNGMVVSAHPQSSGIGTGVLQKGGNAIDAAVATEFALSVCYPEAGNIGGGGFMVIRTSNGQTEIIDYRERAPLKASKDMFLDDKGRVIEGLSTSTHLGSGVPGTVEGMIMAHSKYGRLSFKDVIQPAIDLANRGFPLTKLQAASFNSNRDIFIERNTQMPAYVKDSLWKEGDTLHQTELAATLMLIRDLGREGFYSGTTAENIIKEMERGNGIITRTDLDEYSAVSREPLQTIYRGYKIFSVPPPSSGGIILFQLLGMIEPHTISNLDILSQQKIHLVAEAERRAFADRAEYLGDPEYVSIPVEKLLKKEYLRDRMKTFNESKSSLSADVNYGIISAHESEETTHYSVVDAEGNAVSATTTLNGSFGNSVVVEGAGFLLNNQMDDFSLKPGFPNIYGLIGGEANSIEPGKRMLSSMTPVIIEKNGKLFLVLGSPGGSTIPTSVLQVIINVIDHGINIQAAVDTGRFHHQWLPDQIAIEKNFTDSVTLKKLKEMGHTISFRSAIGRVNSIHILPDMRMAAGADKRGDNSACGY